MRQVKLFVDAGQGTDSFQKQVNNFLLKVQEDRIGTVHAVTLSVCTHRNVIMVEFEHPNVNELASELVEN